MNRQGLILIVDDDQKWREELIEILQSGGYHATPTPSDSLRSSRPPTAVEALALLSDEIYHMLVVDIRMNEANQSNEEGVKLLSELARRGLSEATKAIMLSAYGTKEQAYTAFKEDEAAGFLYKEAFNKQMFLESVRKVFAEKVNINLALDIFWQPGNGPEQAERDLQVAGTSITPGTSLHSQIANELEDLLRRLFSTANSILIQPPALGQSGIGLLYAQPFYGTGEGEHAVVIKFGDFRKIQQEYDNFKLYVQPFLGDEHTTAIQEVRRTTHLGGIIYSLLDTSHNRSAENAQNRSSQEHDTFPMLTRCLARPYIEKAFEHLPWLERNCLLLYTDAEFTQAEIAATLSLETKAVQSHLKSASQRWLYAYNALLENDLGISLPTPVGSPEETLSRVKWLVQSQNH